MPSSSPSSPVSPSSTTVDAASIASASFPSHRLRLCLPPLRPSPSTSSVSITVTSLRSDFHRSQHRSPSSSAVVAVLFSSYLLASVATPSPVSSSSRHRPGRLYFPSTSDYYLDHRRCLPSLFLSLRLHRLHPDTTSPVSLSPSIVPATHRRSPPPQPPPSSPLCCRAPPPLPCFSTPATITLLSGFHRRRPPAALPVLSSPSRRLTAVAPGHLPDVDLPLRRFPSPSPAFSIASTASSLPVLIDLPVAALASRRPPSSLLSPAHRPLPALPLPTTVATSLPSLFLLRHRSHPSPASLLTLIILF